MVLSADPGRPCARLLRTAALKYHLEFKFFENTKKMWVRELLTHPEDLEVTEGASGKWSVKKLAEKKRANCLLRVNTLRYWWGQAAIIYVFISRYGNYI